MANTDAAVQIGLERSDLLYFHEMSEVDRTRLMDGAADYFALEAQTFDGYRTYPDLTAIDSGVGRGDLELVEPNEHFGIVSPIRQRVDIEHLDDSEGSLPLLHPDASRVLGQMVVDIRTTAQDTGFFEELKRAGYEDFRTSVTSLTRTSHYQDVITSQGRFVVRTPDGQPGVSVHTMSRAFDIDHGAFYATRSRDGREIPLNRGLGNKEFAGLARLVPSFRRALKEVVLLEVIKGNALALQEIPDGWGVWHIAIPKAA